jgi:EmrB/QacA subfamily drug resistance transporter
LAQPVIDPTRQAMFSKKPTATTILIVLAFGVFVAADDLTVVSTMLRQIVFDLEIPLPEGLDDAAWIVNAYLIAYVVVMPFVGRISDILGRRPVYIAAFSLFLVGSIWVPLAPDLPWFIFGRVLTALGGGAMVPVGMAIIGDVYEAKKRPTALGTLGAIDTAGWVWGPLYGALLIRFLSWQWQFYLNIPLALIGIAASWWVLRDLPQPVSKPKIDWLGIGALTVGLLALNIALLNSSDIQSVGSLAELTGEESPSSWPLYLLAVVSFAVFILIEMWLSRRRTMTDGSEIEQSSKVPPLIDPSLFRKPNFTPAVFVNFLVGWVLIIAMVNVPLLINVLEIDIQQAAMTSGLLLSAMTVSMAITAYLGGRLTERFSYRPVTLAGLAAILAGFALMGFSWAVGTPYSQMIWQLAILGAGFGLVMAPIGAAVINASPEDQRGIASSLVIVFRLIGMSVGLSSLTAWGLHRFNILRQNIELPPMSEPSFDQSLIDGLTTTTVAVLAETFVISALIAAVAMLGASMLRPDKETIERSEGSEVEAI